MLLAPVAGGLEAKEPKRPRLGPLITIHSPEPRQFELALDEMELDWSHDASARARAPGLAAREVLGARLAARDGVRAIFALSGVPDRPTLRAMAAALRGANPGAVPHLVLYEPGLPQGLASRLVLGPEVSLLLKPGEDPVAVLAGHTVGVIRRVSGLPGAFLVEVGDPFDALALADALRTHPGVTNASPMLKRMFFPR